MKKILLALAAMAVSIASYAQVNITKVDKIQPTDEIFMDMAVEAAKKAVADGQKPEGAVIILNGAWRSTGLPGTGVTPEENAIAKSRTTKLSGAKLYTVNQPTTAALNAIMAAGVDAVFFVNAANEVVGAGIYTDADYSPENLNPDLTTVPAYQIYYAPGIELLKK